MSDNSLQQICDSKSVSFENMVTGTDNDPVITRNHSTRSSIDFQKRNSLPGNLLLNRSMSVSTFLDMTTNNKRKSLPTSAPIGPLPVRRSPHQVARDGDIKAMRILLEIMGQAARNKINELNEDNLAPLHYAARYNHYDMVKLLVEQGAFVNIRGQDGLTPIHFAARSKKGRIPKELFDYSPDDCKDINNGIEKKLRSKQALPAFHPNFKTRPAKNQKFNYDLKLLHHEKSSSSLPNEENPEGIYFLTPDSEISSILLYLVSVGAEINCKDNNGLTPLHYTAMRGDAEAARDLLKCHGINIEARDTDEMTPLHLAAIHGNVEIAELLVMSGANLRCCDDCMATPLHRASMEGNKEIVVMILEAAEQRAGWVAVTDLIRDQDHEQNTSLHLAVANGHHEVVSYLVEKGADVNAPRQNFVCPLHLAAICGDVEITQILLSRTDRIDCLNAYQETPLHLAAEHNHSGVIEFLISRGANLERREKDNCTPLLFAAKHGQVESIETLLQHGSQLSALDKDDKTAIYWATYENKHDALMVLLKDPQSAELVNRPDSFGNTPLHVAAFRGFLGIAQCLLDHGAQIELKNEDEQSALHLAAKFGRTKVVRDLIRYKRVMINGEDEDGNTPLHLAALEGHENVIKALLEVGANVESRNSHNWTPLECAAANGRIRAVRVLLETDCPVDPLEKNKDQTTALHLAAMTGSVSVVLLLLEGGADVTRRDENSKTCLELAIENSHRDVALAIVQSQFWLQALRCEATPRKNGQRNTPLRMLVHKMPDVAEKVLNRCMTTNNLPSEHPQYTVTCNYELIDDTYSVFPSAEMDEISIIARDSKQDFSEKIPLQSKKPKYTHYRNTSQQNHPLMHMVQGHRLKLLGHPLCVTLLHIKWQRFGRYVYYSNLCFYLMFVIALTCYILTTPAPNADAIVEANPDENNTLNVTSEIPVNCSFANARVPELQQSSTAYIGKYVIIGLVAFHLLREFFQFYMLRLSYFGIENLMEWACYITSLLLVIDFTDCADDTGLRYPWQWEVGAMAVFLAWVNLVMFMIRKFPYLGLYVVMYIDVLKTFCKVCIIFVLIIVGYGLAFHVTMYYLDPFANTGNAIARIIVMMLGEFQMDDLFKPDTLRYPTVSYILFISLTVVVTLLMMNLLVGLAVDNVRSNQRQAQLKRLGMMVDLVLNVETVLPKWVQSRFVVVEHTFMPNRDNTALFERLFNVIDNMQTLQEALGRRKEKKGLEKLYDDQDMLSKKMSEVSSVVGQIELKHNQMMNYMISLLKHHNIRCEEEDTFSHKDDISVTVCRSLRD